jgi:hypothetical protein
VRLTSFEILHAAIAGVSRNVTALRDGRQLEAGRVDAGWERHVNGAIAEYAVARELGCCWSPAVGVLDTHTGDLPDGIHVKSTTRADGSLIVREHDPDELAYVLVILALPEARVAGWLSGIEAKVPAYFCEADRARGIHQAAYFVPAGELRPVRELRRQAAA